MEDGLKRNKRTLDSLVESLLKESRRKGESCTMGVISFIGIMVRKSHVYLEH